MADFNIIILIIGATVLLLGFISNYVKGVLPVSLPLLALLLGIILGPLLLNIINPDKWPDIYTIIEETARVTLAISLMGIALRIPAGYTISNFKPLAVMLGIVMPLMFLAGGLLVYLFIDISFIVALLIGATVTPTDPVIASAIVTGQLAEDKIPERIRNILSAESGANDGLAFPLVMLPLLFIKYPAGEALNEWIIKVFLLQIIGAFVFGYLVGYGGGLLLKAVKKKNLITKVHLLSYSVALSLITLSGAKLLNMDGIFSVFVAGIVFSRNINSRQRAKEEKIQEAINKFFTLPIFVLLGAALPWSKWINYGFPLLFLAMLILIFRRLPWVILLNKIIKPVRDKKDYYFTGWFGPIGVAAVFYTVYTVKDTGLETVWIVSTFLISISVLVHGVTATSLTKLYGKYKNN